MLQETDEFVTFAEQGVDPTTAQPFTSTSRLLEVHLQRQFPDDDEVMIGWDPAGLETGQSPVQAHDRQGPYMLAEDLDLVTRIATGDATSGVEETPAGTMRWARVDVDSTAGADDPGGAFIIGHFTLDDQTRAAETVRLVTLISAGVLLLTAGVAWVVAGAILAPIRLVRATAADITERDLTGRIRSAAATTSPTWLPPSTTCWTAWSRHSSPSVSSWTTQGTSCARRSRSCAVTWS